MSSDAGYLAFVRQHAGSDPGAVAFELSGADGSVVLTYGGLVDRVQRLGEALRRAGFGEGDRIALCMENRPAWPVSYLAIWYAGSVVVPLDTALEQDVLTRLLGHSGAVACITSREMATKLRAACASLDTPPLLLSPDLREGEAGMFEPWDGLGEGDVEGSAGSVGDEGSYGEPRAGRAASKARAIRASGPSAAVGRDDPPSTEPQRGGEEVEPAEGEEQGKELPDLEPMASFDAFVNEHGSKAHDWRPTVAADDTLGSIMYTSGTTGDPKGVMVRQNAVLENLRAGVARVHFTPRDRILGILPLFHVLPLITNCLGPLYLGSRVIFLSDLTADAIMAAFRRHDITVFVCVPAFFYRFHDRVTGALDGASGLRRAVVGLLLGISRMTRRRFGWSIGRGLLRKIHAPFGRRMRLFITGGAKMNAQVYDDFLDWGFRLAQGYGLTEATAIITATPLDELRGDTVGKPIDGVSVRIDQPDDEGVGEVLASGPSLMSGYFRNPEATEAVLRGGWLHTGDLGRLLDDGHLQITGRAKDVIVLASGKNIYPDELEGYYGQSELVDELCIIGVPDTEGRGERLHAIVVPDLDAARRRGYVNVREMVKWDLETMGAKLPGPQRLTSLEIRSDPLPRTPTRKLKRFVLLDEAKARAASDPGASASATEAAGEVGRSADSTKPGAAREGGATGTAPRADVPAWTAEVIEVVARYAKRSTVVPSAHLDLDLGMESLDRIELLSEVQRRLGVRLDDDAVGEVHTVQELLDALDAAGRAGTAGASGEGETGNWEAVLGKVPDGIEPYLRRRPARELFMFMVLRTVRAFWRVSAGFRVRGAENVPGQAAFLLCANHTSYVDPFVLCMSLPREALARVFFVGYSEYFESRTGRIFGRAVRNVPIDPNRNLERALQAAAEGLRRGMVLVIFPEGSRSLDGRVGEFRRGAGIIARHLDAPMVPAGISGAREVWPREGKKRLHPITVQIGAPIAPDGELGEGELVESLRSAVVELVRRAGEA